MLDESLEQPSVFRRELTVFQAHIAQEDDVVGEPVLGQPGEGAHVAEEHRQLLFGSPRVGGGTQSGGQPTTRPTASLT